MAASTPHEERRDLAFAVSLSAEPAFGDTAGALAARAGDYAGCASDEARRLGDAVRAVFERMVAGEPYTGQVDVVVHGTDRLVRVELWCSCGRGLEQRLASLDDPDPVRTLVDRVEIGVDGPREFCRLTQQIRPAR